jgi:hypothetical protein
VDPVPDPLLLRKSGSAENQTRDLSVCGQELTTRPQRRSYNIRIHNFIQDRILLVSVIIVDIIHRPVVHVEQLFGDQTLSLC